MEKEQDKDIQKNKISIAVLRSTYNGEKYLAEQIDSILGQQGDFELDTGLLSALGPFLPQERMDRLSERVVPEDLVILNSVAPFLSQDALCRMADRLEQITLEDYLLGVQCLMPFLGKEEMEKLHGKIRDSKKDAGE